MGQCSMCFQILLFALRLILVISLNLNCLRNRLQKENCRAYNKTITYFGNNYYIPRTQV